LEIIRRLEIVRKEKQEEKGEEKLRERKRLYDRKIGIM